MLNQDFLYKLLTSNSRAQNDFARDKNFKQLISSLNKESVVLDIGANIGNVSNYILENLKYLLLNLIVFVVKL